MAKSSNEEAFNKIRKTDGPKVSRVINLICNHTNGGKHDKNVFFKYWLGKFFETIITSVGVSVRKMTHVLRLEGL